VGLERPLTVYLDPGAALRVAKKNYQICRWTVKKKQKEKQDVIGEGWGRIS